MPGRDAKECCVHVQVQEKSKSDKTGVSSEQEIPNFSVSYFLYMYFNHELEKLIP